MDSTSHMKMCLSHDGDLAEENNTKFETAFRICGEHGRWLDGQGIPSSNGWTNYTPCLTPEILEIMRRLGSKDDAQHLILELSRTLKNSRTRIHRHLFVALVIQVTIRLTVYTDQLITRGINGNKNAPTQSRRGIDNTPYLCEASYISLEYARTAMFMWMFVEGLFLNNFVTVTVFKEKLSPIIYPIIGWVVPIPLTIVWAVVTYLQYGHST
ncbi:PDF receptor [Orchesella cincta]|uniref:PDF receptor n=1 Tax=Orchesella cincta TaxID=48709 RepID=A0A1D2M9N6_ORCCI|nr:PDF receptor [Orchesella cincta]